MVDEIKKIIISRTDKIGDLVLSIPSFFMAKRMYPAAELIILVRDYNYDIVKNLPYVDRIIKIDEYNEKELLEEIEDIEADVFVALYVDNLILKLVKKSKAKIKIGPLSKLKSFFVFNRGVYQRRSKSLKNEAEYNLELIRKIDKECFEKNYKIESRIYLEKINKDEAQFFIDKSGIKGDYIVINPFMGGSAKNITDEQYIDLVKEILKRDTKIRIIITAHISDKTRGENLVKSIEDKRVYLYLNDKSILNTAAIIERAKVYFGGSTGPTHMAGVLGRKIVAIYPHKATQNPKRWGVYPDRRDVEYIIPDEDKKESYTHKRFDSYSNGIRDRIVDEIIKKWREKQ